MVDFYLPLKLLKEKLSPNKELSDNSFPLKNASSISKRPISEDDPFNDAKKLKYDENVQTNIGRQSIKSPFIKKNNLEKINATHVTIVSESDNETGSTAVAENQLADDDEGDGNDEHEDDEQDDDGDDEEEEGEEIALMKEVTDTAAQDSEERMTEHSASDEIDEVPLDVLEEMHKLEIVFPTLSSNYRLIDKIGEGTFSTVYKAEAINGAIQLGSEIWKSPPLRKTKKKSLTSAHSKKKNPIVALKQIYVTSSPNRIHNELKLLFLLTGNSHVAPLLDILRYQDQVIAIMPYYQHADYRDFYRDLPIKGIKKYMWELLHALSFIHDKDVIHRDLKPTNFLYDPFKGKGVLVDFGLAEKMETQQQQHLQHSSSSSKSILCPCLSKERHQLSRNTKRHNVRAAYPKQDQRPPRRANRAGTRGFRAPEVLFKCTNQSTKLDIWSAGIIGLSFISRKFPLFNSPDDIDALLELVLVFGLEKLQQCAELHGCGLEVSLPNVNTNGKKLTEVIADFLKFEWENGTFPQDSVVSDTLKILNEKGDNFVRPSGSSAELENYRDHVDFIQMLHGTFRMDPVKRSSAKEVLKMPFFDDLSTKVEDDVIF
ncbi:cell division control protein 7 [[Candida] railenensis]|uniref:non-specific serine/threonine protein kinase n=1 Tax=[Candida] railenensis TaxID=45579 RepID=A0A9P0QV63_9ASCO|nr:cell division control protein 7 [[Candida] railenensis]